METHGGPPRPFFPSLWAHFHIFQARFSAINCSHIDGIGGRGREKIVKPCCFSMLMTLLNWFINIERAVPWSFVWMKAFPWKKRPELQLVATYCCLLNHTSIWSAEHFLNFGACFKGVICHIENNIFIAWMTSIVFNEEIYRPVKQGSPSVWFEVELSVL